MTLRGILAYPGRFWTSKRTKEKVAGLKKISPADKGWCNTFVEFLPSNLTSIGNVKLILEDPTMPGKQGKYSSGMRLAASIFMQLIYNEFNYTAVISTEM